MILTWENIQNIANKYGNDSLTFYVPMTPTHNIMGICFTTSSDKEKIVPCKINEKYNREIKTGYKVILLSEIEGYSYEQYYCSDLVQLINRGYIKLSIKNNWGVD